MSAEVTNSIDPATLLPSSQATPPALYLRGTVDIFAPMDEVEYRSDVEDEMQVALEDRTIFPYLANIAGLRDGLDSGYGPVRVLWFPAGAGVVEAIDVVSQSSTSGEIKARFE